MKAPASEGDPGREHAAGAHWRERAAAVGAGATRRRRRPSATPRLPSCSNWSRTYSRPSVADIEAIERAYHFAEQAHAGQKRESGEPYVLHPLAVAIILAEMRLLDPETLHAALLHDVIEDIAA